MSKFIIFIQFQVVIMASVPWSRKIINGTMLMKNAVLTAALTCLRAQFWFKGFGFKVVIRGHMRIIKVNNKVVVIIIFAIAATWSCTKSFWFLRPMDRLLSFRSNVNEPWSLTMEIGISNPYCHRASFGG